MQRGRRDHVPTVSADIEAGPQPTAGVVPHDSSWMSEVEVSASAACSHHATIRQLAMFSDKAAETVVPAMVGVDVYDDEATRSAGTEPDVGAGPVCPPSLKLRRLGSRCLEPARHARVLCG